VESVTGAEVSTLGETVSGTGIIVVVSAGAGDGIIETSELTMLAEVVESVLVLESLIVLMVAASSFIRKLIVNN
jgi:hypothetical protein